MPINFPTSPALDEQYTYGSRTWKWNGTGWEAVVTPSDHGALAGLGDDDHAQYATNAELTAHHDAASTDHDDRYYTESEVDSALSGKANTSHGTHLTADSVTNTELANMAQSTIKGRAAGGGTGDPQDLSGTQVAEILPTAAASTRGVVVPPGGTTTFLRADGSWVAPAGGAANFYDTSGIPSSGTGADGDFAWDTNTSTRGSIYKKTSGTWSKVGWANREHAYLVSTGWTVSGATKYEAPAATASGWSKTGLAAQSGSQITFAGSTASAWAALVGPYRCRAISGYFTVSTIPVGASIGFGCGMYYGSAWPMVYVSPSGVATITDGFGNVYKTMTGTVVAGDVFAVASVPGHSVVGWLRGNTIQDFALFPAPFTRNVFWETYGTAAVIMSAGAATDGVVQWTNGIEVAL